MKTNYLIRLVILFTVLFSFSSCEVVGGIFKTGVGVGVLAVLLIIGLIVYFISKLGKK